MWNPYEITYLPKKYNAIFSNRVVNIVFLNVIYPIRASDCIPCHGPFK